MILPHRSPIRPAVLLAGSVLALLTGLIMVTQQPPAAVRTALTPGSSEPRSARPSRPDPSTAAGSARSPAPTSEPTGKAVPRGSASIIPPEPRPRPERFKINTLGLSLPIRPVGVDGDGSMELPDDPRELGWYRHGPEPGAAQGSAVLAGHVDSREYGIGPLADLDRLRAGDALTVITAAGSTGFTIDRIRYEPQTRLPVRELFDRTGRHRLVIITCGGPYTPGQGYRDNLIVIAMPDRPAR